MGAHPRGAEAVRVALGREVARDGPELPLPAECGGGGLDERGLPGAGRAHEVDREYSRVGEVGAVVKGHAVVLGEEALAGNVV